MIKNIWGPFEKFVDLRYYFESELCGDAVTVSFSKYFTWKVMHFLQRSTYFSKTCCRPLITSKFLTSELPFHGWKSPEIARGEIWTVWRMFWRGSTDPLFSIRTQNSIQISPHAISGFFQPWKGSSEARNFEVINGLQHVFGSGWSVVRSASLAKGGTSKKRPSPHLHKVPSRSNKASPWTLQTAVVQNYALLPAVLYGCEVWSLTLREEHRLRVFE
jgi:hypothetical protein